jgi:division protein CdvB (Snf7/Vps24/ESCRT-III family)
MWTPAHVRAITDMSAFYEKTPAEMSRYELQELEKIMRMTEEESEAIEQAELEALEGMVDEMGNPLSKIDAFKSSEEF